MASSQKSTELLPKRESAARSGWRLVLISEEGYSSHALPAGGSVTLGRGDDVEIRLTDLAASRRHATLHLGERVRLEDLGGPNGTIVRGRRLEPKELVELGAGDAIELGTTLAVLQPDELSKHARPWTLVTHAHFAREISKARPPFAVLRLQVLAPPGVAQEVFSGQLAATDVVASFGPGQFEVLARGARPEEGQALLERLSAKLVAGGARVRAGVAAAPRDGTDADELIAACSRPAAAATPGFVVRDDAMAALYRTVDRIAASSINVLLLGETGTGKEVLSTEIHRRSKRSTAPFVKINCAALTETLLESELFGHEAGAFTTADRTTPGLLRTANGGTILLDEIGEISPQTQAKLLRVLEERQVRRLGSTTSEPIDVRFLFATNRDLEAEVSRGAFRADLYYRVNGISVAIPPLRDRPSEIEPLARAFAAEFAAKEQRHVPEFTPQALLMLRTWPWPGNIRELRKTIERALLLCDGGEISPAALVLGKGLATAADPRAGGNLRLEREQAERRALLEALEKCGGNGTEAAALLGVSRRTLVTMKKRFGLSQPPKRRA